MLIESEVCDSLKIRYNEQLENTLEFAKANLLLTQQRDSINNENRKVNLRLQDVQKQLHKTTKKKGISVFEGILIGAGAFGFGALIF